MKKLLCIGLLLFLIGNSSMVFSQTSGLKAIDSMKNLMPKIKVDSDQIRGLYRIAEAYVSIDPDSALLYTKRGLIFAHRVKWKRGIAALLGLMGGLKADQGDFKFALAYHQRAYTINKEIGMLKTMAANFNDIGVVYQRQGLFLKSQSCNFSALKLAIAVKDTVHIPLYYRNIGNIFYEQSNYEKAVFYLHKAMAGYQKNDDYHGIAGIYSLLANIYQLKNDYKKAELNYRHALAIFKALDDRMGIAGVYSNMGILYDNDFNKKLFFLLKAQDIYNHISPEYSLSITNLGNIGGTYADIYINKKMPAKLGPDIPASKEAIANLAALYLNKAVAICKKIGDKDNLNYFSDNLAQLHEKRGNYKLALLNFKLSQNLEDTLYSQDNKNKIAHLEAKFNFQRKEDAYQKQQILNSAKQKQLILYGVLAIVLIIAIAAIMLGKVRIDQLKLKNELQQKLAEERTKELLHQNKLSESELKAIRSQMNPHFIFNVLNSIESYILENDPKTASRLVQKFASLSRLILENSTQSMVVADREWKALKLYTELEAMRFNNQFSYIFNVDEQLDLTKLMVPPMLVQPIIENSILHGLRNSTEDGNYVKVSLSQQIDTITFIVEDNGVGLEESKKTTANSSIKSKSIGLSAIRERIQILNTLNKGENAAFDIQSKTVGNQAVTIAILTLPKVLKTN